MMEEMVIEKLNQLQIILLIQLLLIADPPFLGRQKVYDPPLNSYGPPPLLKKRMLPKQLTLFYFA